MVMIEVEVVYASTTEQCLLVLQVPQGTTARAAVLMSALSTHFADVDFHHAALGVFGKKVADDVVLAPYDRVEVYRPLLIDPKENRRRRAANEHKK